jgi:hypothetical protein
MTLSPPLCSTISDRKHNWLTYGALHKGSQLSHGRVAESWLGSLDLIVATVDFSHPFIFSLTDLSGYPLSHPSIYRGSARQGSDPGPPALPCPGVTGHVFAIALPADQLTLKVPSVFLSRPWVKTAHCPSHAVQVALTPCLDVFADSCKHRKARMAHPLSKSLHHLVKSFLSGNGLPAPSTADSA